MTTNMDEHLKGLTGPEGKQARLAATAANARRAKHSLKRGKLSQEEESYVFRYKDRQTAEQMAAKLRRPVSTVQKHLDKLSPMKAVAKRDMKLADELETRPEWANFREQFTAEELEHFKYRYVQLMGQFRDDILPTEEMQIFQVITLDIIVQRVMREQKEITEDMTRTHDAIEKIHAEYADGDSKVPPKQVEKIRELESKYAKSSDQIRNLSQRYESSLMRQSAMMKELKGTRDQRVKIFENSKQSFLAFLRLLNEEDQRITMGREAELMRLAAESERKRMTTPHTYEDRMVDQPLLTPETVQDY